MRLVTVCCAMALLPSPSPSIAQAPPAAAPAPERIRFEPTAGVPTFAVRPPILRVKPGQIVDSRTFSKPGDYYERAGGAWPGEVGPFYIEGRDARATRWS